MKRVLLTMALCLSWMLGHAQEYSVTAEGVGNDGMPIVKIVVSTKKNVTKSAEDLVKRYAVHGIIFRGLMASGSSGAQSPLVKDPNVEDTKADFFNAFWSEGKYKNYATIVGSSLAVMKNKQTKLTETSALVKVNREALQHYLEESGIVKGFSNLW